MIEKITDVIVAVAMFISILALVFFVAVMAYGLTHQKFNTVYSCAYCHNTISENSDIVILKIGERIHAECYRRKIREDANEK